MTGRGCALVLAACALSACSLLRRPPPVDEALRARRLMVPVAGVAPAAVPDDFAAPRDGGRLHGAHDIPAPRGTPVVAADDSIVLAIRWNELGGRVLFATDPERRFVYYYAHLDGYRDGLFDGAPLARGDVVGYVGTTGNAQADGPHLHFQVTIYPEDGRWWAGEPVDPRPFFATAGRVP